MKNWPNKTFGKCPKSGIEVASQTSYSGALIDNSSDENSPVKLRPFRGGYACDRYIKRILREENSKRMTHNTNKQLQYLEQIGVKKEV